MATDVQDILQQAAAILKAFGAREVFVFGSAAKGRLDACSDVDLAVTGLPPEVFFRAMGRAADVLGKDLDLIDLDEDSPFTRYLKEEGDLQRVA